MIFYLWLGISPKKPLLIAFFSFSRCTRLVLGSFGLGELPVSHWCCKQGNAFLFLEIHCASTSGWNVKSLCILTALTVFLTKLMGKNNHTEPQIFRSSYLSSNWKGGGTMLHNSIFIQLCPASLPHNCLHVSNIFANLWYYL